MSAVEPPEVVPVLGAGAIGCGVGMALAESGVRPLLVSDWEEHVAAIRRRGLLVAMPDGSEVEVPADAATTDELVRSGRSFPLAYLASKCQGTVRNAEALVEVLTPDGCVVTVQNGINTDVLAEHLGAPRVIGGASVFGAVRTGPGEVRRTGASSWMVIGELEGGTTPRVEAIAELTSTGDWRTDVSPDVMGVLWAKLINNSQVNAMSVLGGWTVQELMADDRARRVAMDMLLEGVAVASAVGVRPQPLPTIDIAALADLAETDPDAVEADLRRFGELFPGTRVSSLQDVDAGRSTELPWFTGHVVDTGAAHGVPTPVCATVLDAALRIERGEPRTPELIDATLAAAEEGRRVH